MKRIDAYTPSRGDIVRALIGLLMMVGAILLDYFWR